MGDAAKGAAFIDARVSALPNPRVNGMSVAASSAALSAARDDAPAITDTMGCLLLDEVQALLARFIVYPSTHALVAHVLWIVHTHLIDCFESTPRLGLLSKEPASGKTRAMEVTRELVPRPVESVNVTPAYLFRKISDEAGAPTILYDEIDTVFGPKAKENEEIRGVLNAGHRRGATAGRCVVIGKVVTTEDFPAFCAVAMAGLGALPDTILSRCVVIRMRRRAPTEFAHPYRRRVHAPEANILRERIALWAVGVAESIKGAWPEMPPGVEDRDADVWEALLAVADAAGGAWPQRAREAAVALVAESKQSTPSLGIGLLADLRTIFGDRAAMRTEEIIKALVAMEEAPWADMRGEPINARKLSNLLRPYGVSSGNLRLGQGVLKGYLREDLHDPWERYLKPPPQSDNSATSATEVVV